MDQPRPVLALVAAAARLATSAAAKQAEAAPDRPTAVVAAAVAPMEARAPTAVRVGLLEDERAATVHSGLEPGRPEVVQERRAAAAVAAESTVSR